jgi:hypothetical protein
MNRSHTLRTTAGYVVAVALLGGVLTQVPWTTLAATVGLAAPTYDQAAVAATAGSADRAGLPAVATSARSQAPDRAARPWHGTLAVAPWHRDFHVVDVATAADGALVPPDDVSTLGRWDAGARPGDGIGTVALVVHRDSWEQGRGPFAELENLPLGSRVTLGGETYRLDRVTTYPKGTLPSQRVFGQRGPERLVVVTCGGSFSTTRGWDSNVVASFGLDPA